jgi:hypothetical protein
MRLKPSRRILASKHFFNVLDVIKPTASNFSMGYQQYIFLNGSQNNSFDP